jgi:2-oxoglutarate/2-oxoacid ferredoxin oxidoreductase subunit alpha
VALRAVQMARAAGVAAGLLRPVVVWPFPAKRIAELAARPRTQKFVVPEMNLGQMVLEVERAAAGRVPTISLPHAGGTVHRPEEILEVILGEKPAEDRQEALHELAR